MIRTSFNDGWTAGPKLSGFASIFGGTPSPMVTLPHDAIRDLQRSAQTPGGANTGFYPGGYFGYTKTFDVPADHAGKSVTLEFEGVYRDAVVYINGEFAGQRPNGYSNFYVAASPLLRYGEPNVVMVECRAHEDSRWYTGGGIYRDTKIIVTELVHVALDGIRITTPDIEADQAVVAVATTVENEERTARTVRVTTRILNGDVVVANNSTPLTLLAGASGVTRARLYVRQPALWNVESPHLYTAHTTVTDGDQVLDEEWTTFGIRKLQLDPRHGLRINGETVKLRGANLHHDTGLLGSAAISRAEERRVEILKSAGFNAIRSAHNPISKATLEACDRIGMLVMDETFDVWTQPKSPFDYSLSFPEWWERDVAAMVAKDFNHPSVIMYSVGNEIFETGRPIGSAWGRKLAEKTRSLDDTRFVTNAINGMVSVLHKAAELLAGGGSNEPVDVNSLGALMNYVGASDIVTQATEESHGVLDVSGINYSHARYELDRDLFPDRIIVGTETIPGDIAEIWRLVEENNHVIGDFTWTGWDYLGESGVGRVDYPDEDYIPSGFTGAYPWMSAFVGDVDITGFRRPASYYRETVFGRRNTPYIAVHRPEFHGRATSQGPWSWTDSVASWSWDVPAGSPATIDVYSDADEVELIVNDRSLGRAKVGTDKPYLARYETTYEPGEVTAIAYAGATEQGRIALHTASGATQITAAADRLRIRADDTDLAYVTITLEDDKGNVLSRDRRVTLHVEGAGVLAALGTGRPNAEEPFGGSACTTYDGRALAIVRPTGPGDIRVTITSEGLEAVLVTVIAESV